MNDNNGIKEPTCEYPNWNTNQMLIFCGYVEVRESLYAWIFISTSIVPSYIDVMVNLRSYEDFKMVYIPKWC